MNGAAFSWTRDLCVCVCVLGVSVLLVPLRLNSDTSVRRFGEQALFCVIGLNWRNLISVSLKLWLSVGGL